MNETEFQALVDKLGPEIANKVRKELENYESKMKVFAKEVIESKGENVSLTTFKEFKESADAAIEAVKTAAKEQGVTLTELNNKLNSSEAKSTKSISQVLSEDVEKLRQIYSNGQGVKTYMVTRNEKGAFVMAPFDTTKAVGPNATIDAVISGAVASVTQALDSVSLLRMGMGAQINSQYRNSPWVFDQVNVINASFNGSLPFAVWFDELAKVGSSATVLEGATKPLVQYFYELHSATYKKEAALIGFTQEFSMDFPQLESDIMNKGRLDLLNRVSTVLLADIVSIATAYNTGTAFKDGDVVENVNDFDVIAAMAAQVDSVTYGANANTALMSTYKKYRMGITKQDTGGYLNIPDILANIAFIGNPDMGTNVIVGDLKQYNVILRGGLIVRVGYNGTDFAENKFSVVMEQFYYNYISALRKTAIVKGPDFATVKTAISS